MKRPLASVLSGSLVVAMFFAPGDRASAFDPSCNTEVAATHAASLGRGGDEIKEPVLDQPVDPLPASAKGKGARAGFRATIPVYWHVVSLPDGTGNVSDADIDTQVRIMNRAYGGNYGGVDTGFRFELAGVTRTVNEAWYYAGPTTRAEREMKKALATGLPYAMNFYSTTAGPYLGWAYLPGLPESQLYLDGIVVDWESMYRTSTRYEDRYDLGLTAVHESGHFFGLLHTFDGGCTPKGDMVADTPPERTPTSGCPLGKDTCSAPGADPIHNYMDYSYDSCYFEFTAGQASRQQDYYAWFRTPAE